MERAVGSALLKGKDKLTRMMELAGVNEEYKVIPNENVKFVKRAPNNVTYAVIKENHSYFVKLTDKKENINESDFQYIGSTQERYDKRYRFHGYSDALRCLNGMFDSINEAYGITTGVNLFESDNLEDFSSGKKKV